MQTNMFHITRHNPPFNHEPFPLSNPPPLVPVHLSLEGRAGWAIISLTTWTYCLICRTLHKQGMYGGQPVVKRTLVITPGSLVKVGTPPPPPPPHVYRHCVRGEGTCLIYQLLPWGTLIREKVQVSESSKKCCASYGLAKRQALPRGPDRFPWRPLRH